ncbi:hypothetical protein [Salipaludibacillus aurantiacus]|uniref:Uncharacterized protein n=1 Tax=Salipaludibacillus aurantiacus TaxID=1601833 RepID=A0A1H9SLR0_9BACI|nr:hypothetical protein [Salipaludibacillus aurantiacus]SER85881.1 hypothetical protein SAMN05518684_104294 [Salipaludibacillus aurantiacus]
MGYKNNRDKEESQRSMPKALQMSCQSPFKAADKEFRKAKTNL